MPSDLKTLREDGQGESVLRVARPLYGGTFTTDSRGTIAFVLPGELISPPDTILGPAAERVVPRCIHFGTCGGCHYQHAVYPLQLDLKRTILDTLLTEAGLRHLSRIQLESAVEYGYRNRIRLRIEPAATGHFQAGYSLPGTNEFLPIRMCPISAPILWQTAETLLSLAETDPLIHRWLTITSEIELFTSADESKIQVQFFVRTPGGALHESSSFPGLCERLRAAVPALAGASALLDPELNRRARRAWSGVSWGAEGLVYHAADRPYWVPRGAFFQVNRFLIDRLVQIVTAKQHGDIAWDLYAGVGLFTRALADTFARITAVEGAETAAASLAAIKLEKGAGTIEPVHSSTLDFLRARQHQRERPALIVCDPPRAGLGPEACEILARIAAPEIVYVSCDPTTLARDLAVLAPTYGVQSIHLIDLFPQTFHIETIVHLGRL